VADQLPEPYLLELGRLFGDSVHTFAPGLRARARRRLSTTGVSHDTAGTARQSFARAGENLMLSLLMRRRGARASDFVRLGDAAQRALETALAPGRGAVFVSAHLGPFELIAARVAELELEPAILVRESYDARLDPIVDAHRERAGVTVVHRGHPGASARILRLLKRGHPVGFLVDLPSRVRSLDLPFLGVETPIPVGPQRLAQLTGAPLLVGTLSRIDSEAQGNRPLFNLEIRQVRGSGWAELTQRVSGELERSILSRPEDWPWMA
jgi:KDO2-lipid IV(A) lauroyltransferase